MFERVLVLGAHTDDIEMMCGGAIVKLLEMGCDVHYSTFSFADKSLPEGFPEGTTRDEVYQSTSVLGIDPLKLYLYDHEVRILPAYRQEILEELISLKKLINPNLVITHNSHDTHQDHKTVSDETFRAFKQTATIWGYESFKNNRVVDNDLFFALNVKHVDKKIEAISQYKSQIIKYDNRDAIRSLAQFRGAQIHHKYAECFQVLRVII